MRWFRKLSGRIESVRRVRRSRRPRLLAAAPEVFESRVLLSAEFFGDPSIAQLGAPVAYAVGGAPVVVAPTAVVADTNSVFANSKLTVSVAHWGDARVNFAPTDELGVAASAGVTVQSNGDLLYNGSMIGNVSGGTSGAPLVVSFDANATQAGVQAVLDSVAYANSSATPMLGARLVMFQFTDGSGDWDAPVEKPVFVTPAAAINGVDEPVTYTAGAAPTAIASSGVVSDVAGAYANSRLTVALSRGDDVTPSSAATDELSILADGGVTLDQSGNVSYNGAAIAVASGGTGTTPLVIAFNAAATQAGIDAVLNDVAYANSNPAVPPGTRAAVFQFTDGNGSASLPTDVDLQIVPAASISQLGAPATYAAGASPVIVAPTGAVTDANGAYANSTLHVAIAARGFDQQNDTLGDELSIVAGGGVTLGSQGAVLYNGSTIGMVTGGTAGAPLVVTFNSTATQASIQAVLDDVAFSNSSANPETGARVVVFQFTDGNGSASLPACKLVQVTLGASITDLGGPVVYAAGEAPVVLAPNALVTDVNHAFANSQLTVAFEDGDPDRPVAVSNGDQLSIAPSSTVTLGPGGTVLYNGTAIGTVTGGTGGMPLTVAFNASATQAGVQAVAESVAFSNSNADPKLGPREVVFQFTDGSGEASLAAGMIVQVTSSVAITNVGGPVEYQVGAAPVLLVPNAIVTDAANAFANSQLEVSNLSLGLGLGNSMRDDVLSILASGGVTLGANGAVLYNGTTIGTMTGGIGGTPLAVAFNANATQVGVQAVLDNLAYSNWSTRREPVSRFVVIQFTDGNGTAATPVGKLIETEIGLATHDANAIDDVFAASNFNWWCNFESDDNSDSGPAGHGENSGPGHHGKK